MPHLFVRFFKRCYDDVSDGVPTQRFATIAPLSGGWGLWRGRMLGQEVAQVLDETLSAGEHEKALDIRWWSSPQGPYFLCVQTPTLFQQQLLQVMR